MVQSKKFSLKSYYLCITNIEIVQNSKSKLKKFSFLCTFNKVVGVYLVQVSLLLIGQQGLEDFFRYRPMLPIGWRIVQIVRKSLRKTTNPAPTTLSALQAASQSTFVNTVLCSTCDEPELQK
jgi:hypothetical protein